MTTYFISQIFTSNYLFSILKSFLLLLYRLKTLLRLGMEQERLSGLALIYIIFQVIDRFV